MLIGFDLRLPYYQMGGISQYSIHLLQALAQLNHADRYVILHSRKDHRDYTPDAPHFQRAVAWTPCHHQWERWALSAEITPFHFDLFHSPDFIPPQFGAKRKIITIHDLNFLYYPHYLTQESLRYYQGQIKWAVQHAEGISADSHHTRQDLIDKLHVHPDKVHTVHLAANPVYRQSYSAEAIAQTLQQLNLPADFLLFVGTIEPRKNIQHLIRVYYALCEEEKIEMPLILIGRKGWLADDVFTLIEQLHLQNRVRHLTGIYDEQLAHLYHAASILLLPSHYEGFGLPPLEAMHCGCPVVTSDRGSLPEIVGEAGFLLDPDDEPLWADTIMHVLDDFVVRQGMIERGYKQAQRFTWERAAAETHALYRGEYL